MDDSIGQMVAMRTQLKVITWRECIEGGWKMKRIASAEV
jgi:hypothetical protein